MTAKHLILLCCIALAAGACASDADRAAPVAPSEQPAKAGSPSPADPNTVFVPAKQPEVSKPEKKKNVRVTVETMPTSLGRAVREIGEQAGGNIVLMNGVEDRVLQGVELKKRTVPDAVAVLAAGGGLFIEQNVNYYFLYPEGYDELINLSMAGRLDPRYATITTDAAFGSGLPLCSVFMWMSYALRISIVADNSVGDARCGELALAHVPLDVAIEGILKSARVVALAVESTPEYIFLATPANANPPSALLDETSLNDAQRAVLERKIRLALPRGLRTGQPMELPTSPSTLEQVLPALSEQLGVRVVAEKGLLSFPVNPFYLHEARMKTALDLLVRQWLEPNYGYQVLKDRIVLRRK